MVPDVESQICDIVSVFKFELNIKPSVGGFSITVPGTDGLVYHAEGADFETVLTEVWTQVCG